MLRTAPGLLMALVLAGCGSDPGREVATTPVPVVTTTTPTTTPRPGPSPSVDPARSRRLGLRAVAALKAGDPDRAVRLIRRGADVNAQDDIEDSVLLYAGAEGFTEVVRVALRHGADLTVLNRYGGTALIPASEHAHVESVRLLLAAGTPVDHVNDLGWTALGEAVALGNGDARHVRTVRLLLAAGADPRARDRFGRTVIDNADRLGFASIARLLRSARTAEVDAQ